MTEQEANEVMHEILVHTLCGHTAILKHLYDLHQLRDRRLHLDLQGETIDGPGVLWPLYYMQTCYS